jgi:hypothetical protein
VLRYNPTLGTFSHFAAHTYVAQGTGPLLSITAILPDAGFYMFGIMNFTQDSLIPVSTNYWIDYLTDYDTMKMVPDNGNVVVKLKAEQNSRIAIMKLPTVFWMPDGYEILYSMFINGDIKRHQGTMDLMYRSNKANVTWGYCKLTRYLKFSPNITAGSRWTLDNRTRISIDSGPGYVATLTTSETGHWAVLAQSERIIKNSGHRSTFHFLLFLFLLI